MPILKTMQRIPGGMMLIPLLLGATLNTLFPHAATFFGGSFTGAIMAKGSAVPLLAVFFVCIGATIDFRAAPRVMGRGGALLLTKLATAAAVGMAVKAWLGTGFVETGLFAGFSALAVVAAMNDTNGGLYMALVSQFGKKEDAGAYSLMSLESGAFFTMLTLLFTGDKFPWPVMVGVLLPLIVGMILGNLDKQLRAFLTAGVPVLIPFFALALGFGINLGNVATAGVAGVLLGIMVVVITGATLFLTDRLTGGNGIAGIAAASTAGNATGVPLVVAGANALYAPSQPSATVMVSASVVVTAILVPLVTAWWAKRVQANEAVDAPEPVAAG